MNPTLVRFIASRLFGVITSVITAVTIYKIKEKLDDKKYKSNKRKL